MKYLFKTILRNFIRKPVVNLINLGGLAISFTLVIILSVYCYSELNTDSFQKNSDRVFLFGLEDHVFTPGILKDEISQKIPGVEAAIRLGGTWEPPVFKSENRDPITSDLLFADDDFFKLFTYRFIEGSAETALLDPMNVVITSSLSKKLFGDDDALGKTLKLNDDKDLKVSAVIEEPKANSCIAFSALTSIATMKIVQDNGGEFTEWGWRDFQTFVLLGKDSDPEKINHEIISLFPEKNKEDFKNTRLTPLKKVYFSTFSLYGGNYIVTGDKKKVGILVLVASLVLLIALINYINISSSQWSARIRQTGVLKVIGAKQSSIFMNTIGESFFFFLAALLISVDIVYMINPFVQNYTGIHYNPQLIISPGFILISLTAIAFLSIAASVLPAMRTASSRAVDNLKKNLSEVNGKLSFRGLLVTIQFTIAIVLIAFTILVQKQVRFGCSTLGFNQKNILGIKLTAQLDKKRDVLKNMLGQKPGISRISYTQYYPGKTISQWGSRLVQNNETKEVNFSTFSADAGLFDILGLQLVSGRLYSDDLSTDKKKIVVNETFLSQANVQNAIGAKIEMGTPGEAGYSSEIIGVIKDFHFESVNQPIGALAIRNDSYASYCLVSFQTEDFKSLDNLVTDLKKISSQLSPSFPVEITFVDQAIQKMYQSETRFRRTFSLFSVCSIVICCMGILAMSLFACSRRIKEIGIRKVNGARIIEIIGMLNKDFIKWVIIAFLIACPVSWLVSAKWLQGFAYKTELSWWIFAVSGIIALGIAVLTISWQSWRAATRNPVEALRYE
jgi:putative ABC transport system permease protein